MATLVQYVTEMPTAADSEARRFKYPFVASEVLSCDTAAIREALFGSPALIKQLLHLLDMPPPLPAVLAGYVCKILTSMQKATDGPEAFKRFFDDADGVSVDDLLPKIMVHVGSDAFLQMLITLCVGTRHARAPAAHGAARAPARLRDRAPHQRTAPRPPARVGHDAWS